MAVINFFLLHILPTFIVQAISKVIEGERMSIPSTVDPLLSDIMEDVGIKILENDRSFRTF